MAKRYLIETFGCQMNVHDSERIAGLLERAGYSSTDRVEEADLIVLNTCSVRERAEEKLYSRLGEIARVRSSIGRRPMVAVAGCVAQQEGAAIRRRSSAVDVVVGTQSLKRLPDLVQIAESQREFAIDINPYEDVCFPLGVARHGDPVKAFVTIVEGCNDHCAFCVVPHTRGRERARPVADIVAEVREACRTGHTEVHLLGQIVNHYQAPDDRSCDFAELLARVHEVDGLQRIRFASPHPRHVSSRLIEAIRDLPKVCKHIHLPVQSGSTRILALMHRRHTREQYLDLVDRLRAAIPGIALSTDMIVGFSGETGADFEETLSLVRRVRFSAMFSFKYSVRPNTFASRKLLDDVAELDKTLRLMTLQTLQREIQLEHHRELLGRVLEVLVDGVSRRSGSEVQGRTSGNTVVNLPGPRDWIGRLVNVRILGAGANSLRGEALPADMGSERA